MIRGVAILLLAVVVGFGAYFFVYLQNRETTLVTHYLDVLGDAGDYVSDALTYLSLNARNAASIGRADVVSSGGDLRSGIVERMKLIPGLDSVRDVVDLPEDQGYSPTKLAYPLYESGPEGQSSVVGQLGFFLNDQLPDAQVLVEVSRDSLDPDGRRGTMQWQTPLRTLAERFLPDEFDAAVIVRANGAVLLGNGSSPLRLSRMVIPRPRADSTGIRPGGSATYPCTVGGQQYKAFVQPIALPIVMHSREPQSSVWARESSWYIVGLVRASRLRTMSMAIPPSAAWGTMVIIVLGLLALPIVRVRYIGARERLRYMDLALMAGALLIGTSVVTISGLAFLMQEQAAERAACRLSGLSKAVQRHFVREVEEMDSTLAEMGELHPAHPHSIYKGVLGDEPEPFGSSGLRSQPFFDMAYWIDRNGMQTSKWGIRQTPTPLVPVKSRRYFLDASQGRLFPAPSPWSGFQDGRVIESIRSNTTGREAAVVSRVLAAAGHDSPNVVAALEYRLRSVIAPALPDSEGFAILEPSGRVLFHSDCVRNLRENFYDELGAPQAAKDAVLSRETATLRTTYGEMPCLMRFASLPGTPWTLVTFEDRRLDQQWQTQVLCLSVFAFGAYLIFFLALALAVLSPWRTAHWPGEVRRLWYWPDREKRRAYEDLLLYLLPIAIAFAVIIGIGFPIPIIATVVVAPVLVLTLFREAARDRIRRGPWPDKWSVGLTHRDVYSLALSLLIIVCGALPAAAVFRLADDEVQFTTLLHRIGTFEQAMERRRSDLSKWYDDVHLREPYRTAVYQAIRGHASTDSVIGIYTPSQWHWSFGESVQRDTHAPPLPLLSNLVTRLLARAGLVARPVDERPPSRGARRARVRLEDTLPTGASIAWHGDTLRYQNLETARFGQLGAPDSVGGGWNVSALDVTAVNDPPRSETDWRLWALVVLGVVCLTALVRLCLRHGLLGGLGDIDWLDPSLRIPLGGPEQSGLRVMVLRVRVGREQREQLRQIGIREIRSMSTAELLYYVRSAPQQGILLSQFDYGLTEPAVATKKLELLEALNDQDLHARDVFVETSVEPLAFLTTRCQESPENTESAAIALERWAAALQAFMTLRVNPARVTVPDLDDASKEGRPRATLKVEAAPTAILRRIADQLGQQENFAKLKRDEVVGAMREMASAHYRRLWTSCSTEERVLLHRVASEGLVSRSAREVLLTLLRRGLVVRRPNCCIMNESFRLFILHAERPETFVEWERHGGPSLWSKMRGPALVALGILAAFFFATQREALSQSLGLLAAVAALAPGVISILSNISRSASQDVSGKSSPA